VSSPTEARKPQQRHMVVKPHSWVHLTLSLDTMRMPHFAMQADCLSSISC
jgi:hypothetical protein